MEDKIIQLEYSLKTKVGQLSSHVIKTFWKPKIPN
jgi:hypothetical protein